MGTSGMRRCLTLRIFRCLTNQAYPAYLPSHVSNGATVPYWVNADHAAEERQTPRARLARLAAEPLRCGIGAAGSWLLVS